MPMSASCSGGPIGKNQSIQHPLAECWSELYAAELMTLHAAELYDAGKPCGAQANAAKYLAADAGFRACDRAIRTHGGMGYAAEYPCGALFPRNGRDAARAGLARNDPVLHRGARARLAEIVLRGEFAMIRGSCACGGIRFEIDEVRSLTNCHCTNCRKLTAASLATYAHVEKDKFRFVSGEDLINRYESGAGQLSLVLPGLQLIGAGTGAISDDRQRARRAARRRSEGAAEAARLHVLQSALGRNHRRAAAASEMVPGYEPKQS